MDNFFYDKKRGGRGEKEKFFQKGEEARKREQNGQKRGRRKKIPDVVFGVWNGYILWTNGGKFSNVLEKKRKKFSTKNAKKIKGKRGMEKIGRGIYKYIIGKKQKNFAENG